MSVPMQMLRFIIVARKQGWTDRRIKKEFQRQILTKGTDWSIVDRMFKQLVRDGERLISDFPKGRDVITAPAPGASMIDNGSYTPSLNGARLDRTNPDEVPLPEKREEYDHAKWLRKQAEAERMLKQASDSPGLFILECKNAFARYDTLEEAIAGGKTEDKPFCVMDTSTWEIVYEHE